ncbi:MAG: HlyD family efflux transporter periplasmic adaptor subunit, partial [Planctomycetia bacterium]|nr:HlyD family efflux transporter periplasmic adaptor subunit [Planctomycetia bacterium]
GSTRIISILPEGARVKANDVVCELDASAFREELQAQKIRWAQAKALVEQAKAIQEVNEITYKEYNEGIFPQDVQLVRQYLTTCTIETERARKNLEWSKQTAAKGFRASAQVKADVAAFDRAEIAQREAGGMITRLEKFTGPRLKKNLLAKIEAIRADRLAQESVYQLESDRLRRLEEMVANCTLRAPRDGIVVYANQANGWGQTQNPIQEGVTVRQGQAIINLPDPNHMQVRAMVNESKVSSIHVGQKALIRVDAFPDRPMIGTVEGVTPIPAPSNRSGQDVRVYFATVAIDSGGFDALRPGLSAEVTFRVGDPRKVTRVPLQAVRWVHETPYVAVTEPSPAGVDAARPPAFRWRNPVLGQSDASYIEVLSGLRPGDRVIARPDRLPAPGPSRPAPVVAGSVALERPRG